jgi:rhodanese-related sulfurtransferase
MIFRTAVTVTIALVVVAVRAQADDAPPADAPELRHTPDTLDEVRKNLDDKKALLLDVREDREWKAGHIEGAILLPLSELRKQNESGKLADHVRDSLPKSNEDRPILYCHCARGQRCLVAGGMLQELGYDVRPLKPGYKDLIDAGFPTAKEEPAQP